MYSEEFDLLVDWQGADLEEGKDAQERALVVTSSDGVSTVRLINIKEEALFLLRVNAAVKYGLKRFPDGTFRLQDKP